MHCIVWRMKIQSTGTEIDQLENANTFSHPNKFMVWSPVFE